MNNHEIRDRFYSNQSVKASESFIQIIPLEKKQTMWDSIHYDDDNELRS